MDIGSQPVHSVVDDREQAGLEHFGSARAVMMASIEEIALVPGIGEKTAATMCRILDEPATGTRQRADELTEHALNSLPGGAPCPLPRPPRVV